ncbi:MAG: Lrp/AsnC family transcriptional regulator [Nocardioides sp.]
MSTNPPRRPAGPPPRRRPDVDAIDRAILAVLARDGRISNVALADEVGLAETTCAARMRSLRERGVLSGVHAEVDLARLGCPSRPSWPCVSPGTTAARCSASATTWPVCQGCSPRTT